MKTSDKLVVIALVFLSVVFTIKLGSVHQEKIINLEKRIEQLEQKR